MDNFVIRKNTKPLSNNKIINVYTDGACTNNGKPDARAGFGIWFGEDDKRNTSESFTGPQTNNRAELLAIIKALTILRNEIEKGQPIMIYSDSSYSIRCCTTYGEKMSKKGWQNKGQDIPNREIVEVAYNFVKKYNNIDFTHIRAHTGLTDKHSIGNEHADRLANLSIGVESCPYQRIKSKIYLNVPYDEKDEAKKMGAKWDKSKKRWYITPKNNFKVQIMGRWGLEN
jgi:ribonuclease HI